ncbi:hypothetical protein GCK72_004589 [Caenorhabditis remanei]|uniref:F-box domain-containing protein n=1 Tax=Caenorhabditis remanei TaxID=31234 RepID=A0A6A5HA06_CAERE|nr:hypothetical protein GCK72_004589 [Caenorhabditis remanei]KAF1764640.1 hypothetical protein GCK72_004589 [Caenorhabditis remanei]
MPSAFSLLYLPKKALHHVLYSIDYVDIVAFSLASNKTKEVVKSLNLKIHNISLTLNYFIRIQIDAFRNNPSRMLWNFYPEKYDNSTEPIPVYMPARVIGMRDTNPVQNLVKYRNPGLSIQEWFAHFQYIFSFPEEKSLRFTRETCKFDLSSLKETIGESEIGMLEFHNSCSLECAQMVLRQFPSVKRFFAFGRRLVNPSLYSNILIKNLDTMALGHPTLSLRIELDDLLLINSKEIYVCSLTITNKVINQFLKFWMRGSNPRMEVVNFDYPDGRFPDKDVLLKGTNYHETLSNQVRHYYRHEKTIMIQGGYDIRQKDGTVGTVSILQHGQGQLVRLFVWS